MKQIAFRSSEELISTHMKLVISIARKFQNRGLEMEDLIQEGNVGLIKASEKYDHSLGYEFTTYATYWIQQCILKAIYDTGRTIRLPVHLRTDIGKLLTANKELSQNDTAPSVEELAKLSGLSEEVVKSLQSIMPDTISLETPVGGEKETSLMDLMEDETSLNPEDSSQTETLKRAVASIIDSLPVKEAAILKLRFGFENDEELTLEEIGVKFKITRERVRQIEAQALKRLNHPVRRKQLKAMM